MMIAASNRAIGRVLDNLDRKEPAALERLFRLLAIPSVSTDPAYHDFCIEAAEACVGALRKIGFEVRVEPTLGKPTAVGQWHAPEGRRARPRVLFYGHYDVQPPDPLDQWSVPPFEPRLVEDPHHGKVIVARGRFRRQRPAHDLYRGIPGRGSRCMANFPSMSAC